jgi:ABC-type Fe3+ transport system substrate-binding protein
VVQNYGIMKRIQRKGAPIAMDFVEPVPVSATYLVLPKNSAHPNAGLLFAAFIASPQGQAVYEDVSGSCSIYVETCSASQLLKGKKLAILSSQWALKGGDLAVEWSKALGLQPGK